MEVDSHDQKGVCALYATAGSDCDVQQGELGNSSAGRWKLTVQDMDSVTSAVSTLKRLSILEPDLIMPAMMERIVPSLQGLEEVSYSVLI